LTPATGSGDPAEGHSPTGAVACVLRVEGPVVEGEPGRLIRAAFAYFNDDGVPVWELEVFC
jgi:hypothetical protein